jgi:iron complex outermembrane receptor protein
MTRSAYLLLSGVSLFGSTAAFAQGAAQPPANSNSLQDIIVTAQRKAENVINVPLSIQAISGQNLASQNIQKFDQLSFTTPGFVALSGTGYTEAFIRGVGNAVLVGADPSVTVNVDDVPHVYGSLISDFVNVERLEVLKGAQGGLYGRNATGGVINIITKQPGDKLAFDGTTSYGSYQTWNTSLYLNVPITDKIAWNVAVSRKFHDGYEKNIAPKAPYVNNFPGDVGGLGFLNQTGTGGTQPGPAQLNNGNVWSVDTKLKITPTDNFKVTLGWDYTEKKDAGGNGWDSSDYGFHGQGNPLTGAAQTYDLYMHEFLGNAGYAANAHQIAHIESLFVKPGRGNLYGAYLAYAPTRDYGASLRAVWSLPGFDITNISAYRWNESRFQGDIGAAPVAMAGFQVHVTRHYLYQEDRIQTTSSGPFHFLGGGTYFTDQIGNRINGQFLGFTLAPTTSVEKTTSWSIYGQVAYDFTSRLTLTGSLRYIHETRNAVFPAFAPGTDPINPTGAPETSNGIEHKFVPAVTLSYKTDQGTIYARWARGFKTGGVNPLVRPTRYQFYNDINGLHVCAPGQCSSNVAFGGETVDTYEIGYRTNLFNHRAQLTTAIFYNNYSNLQTAVGGNQFNPDVSLTFLNAKKARTYGAEASLTVKVAPPLTISANIGYLNAKYTDFKFGGNAIVDAFDFSGHRMQLAPKWQGGVSADLDQPITDKLHLVGTILASYTGAFFYSPNNINSTRQKGYWNVNTRIGIRSADRHYGIFLDVENVFNQLYWSDGANYQNPDGSFRADNVLATPRIIKGTLELHF